MNDQFLLTLKNPIVRDHRVYGKHLLPGLAYIDLIYQFSRKHGHEFFNTELRNLAIYHPLIVNAGSEVLVRLNWTEIGAGARQVVIEGHEQRDGRQVGEIRRYARAETHRVEVVEALSPESTGLGLASNFRSERLMPLADLYAGCRSFELVHGDFMRPEGHAYEREGCIYVDCSLSQAAQEGASRYMFHPALLDGSAVCTTAYDMAQQPAGVARMVLPLSFGSFRATALIQRRCLVRMRKESLRDVNQLTYFTLEFFDETGRLIAILTDFAGKLVRDPSQIDRERASRETISLNGAEHRGAQSSAAAEPSSQQLPEAFAISQAMVRRIVAERSQRNADDVDPGIGFYEMGLASSVLLEVVEGIERELGVRLPPTLLFEYTSVAELASHLATEYPARFAVPGSAVQQQTEKSYPPQNGVPATAVPVAESGLSLPQQPDSSDVAIIGMSGRFPLAQNVLEFWENLKAGKDCITEVPAERWDSRRLQGLRSISGKPLSIWGGFLKDADSFDAGFFRISPREAEMMDPQERLFLEISWEAIEDAGYTPRSLVPRRGESGRRHVGVFVGVMHKDYSLVGAETLFQGQMVPLSLNYAPIANRVSYFCNFHGPSIAVDTTCSSSLTAVHLAIQSLHARECEVAIAGGVNLSLHPAKYMTYGMLDMHSSKGRCQAFGKGGDGYVSGEGVGAVLLKPLHQAMRDGDQIYAVIKGSTVSHVGSGSGITVPNPVAQAELIAECLRKTGIDPRTISYVETHGTGTSLGDPIEVDGLTKAYRRFTSEKSFCALGSVKSNIGHTESAAGVSGLIKVALQLRHRTLVPSLHSEELNPHIDWENSPFFVQRRTESWNPARMIENGREVPSPRRAALSSYGATGSNAHLILEESPAPATQRISIAGGDAAPVVVPLSAHDEEQLQAYVRRLAAFLEMTTVPLSALAYTLQVGREAMEHRVAFVVASTDELRKKLSSYLAKRNAQDYFAGFTRQHRTGLGLLVGDEDSQELLEKWIAKGRSDKLAELWVQGFAVDWEKLYAAGAPPRVSLPTYPFARERFWVSARYGSLPAVGATSPMLLHPLVHRNTSNLQEQRFTSSFTGEEPFLSDHVVQSKKTMPAAAQLEMARAAVELSAAEGMGKETVVAIRNVLWARPLTIEGAELVVHIGVYPKRSGEITFEIYTQPTPDGNGERNGDERVVYSQGTAVFSEAAPADPLDVTVLRDQCGAEGISAGQCYEVFRGLGIEYGPAHRGLQKVLHGTDIHGRPFVLADLTIPDSARAAAQQYSLHPSLVDAALQACLALTARSHSAEASSGVAVPFTADNVEVFDACPQEALVLVREQSSQVRGVRKLDLDVADREGRIVVRIQGYTYRLLESGAQPEPTTLLYEPGVRPNPVTEVCARSVPFERRWLISGELEEIEGNVKNSESSIDWLALNSPEPSLARRIRQYATTILHRLQQEISVKSKGRLLIQLVVLRKGEASLLRGLWGLLNTAQLENPKIAAQLIAVEPGETRQQLIAKLEENACRSEDRIVEYRATVRHTLQLSEVEHMSADAQVPAFRKDGVYLITGGTGSLGLIFAREIAQRAPDATIILLGRSELTELKREELESLRSLGIRVEYFLTDITEVGPLAETIRKIESSCGPITSILHAAGVLRDSFLLKKTDDELNSVLAPKVDGTLNVDHACAHCDLDFFVLFSSTAGIIGNIGQADYAAANAFQDAFAAYRSGLVATGERRGRTVSINWPLWAEGGMQVDEQAARRMRETLGLMPLLTHDGMAAFYRALRMEVPQVAVFAGEASHLRTLLSGSPAEAPQPPKLSRAPLEQTSFSDELLPSRTKLYLKKLLSAALNLGIDRIETDARLEKYGIDSLAVMHLTGELEKHFGSLSKTLFFEYQTLDALADYLLESYGSQLKTLLVPAPSQAAAGGVSARVEAPVLSGVSRPRFAELRRTQPSIERTSDDGIAIVGIAGRYPQANNLAEFWEILRAGKDCITEIPKDRWDHSVYFDPVKGKTGKTYGKWGGFLDGVDQFDPEFFNISPREAPLIDPQERLFLQCVFETLEDAGYTRDELARYQDMGLEGNVGVFVGVMYEEYQLYGAQAQTMGIPFALAGNPSSIASRVSYFCNFHGPSIAVDTMCSSSLAALHLACESLRRRGCEWAIAGGVNVSIHPNKYLALSQGQFLSSEGRCRSFGAGGDGYVPGEGVGAVLLRPLSDAIDAGDHIYGVIKATALNHGGKTNGYSVPNPAAQANVIAQALKNARVPARSIGYIEAHGTGTLLGDPIEITALTKAFSQFTDEKQFCAIGSVKSNIGHCESAASIAGLTKILLQFQNGQLAPSLHANTLNPNIEFESTPFVVQTRLEPWNRPSDSLARGKEGPRTAGLSSFGASGVNAHVIVQEWIDDRAEQSAFEETPLMAVIVLSARTELQLKLRAARLLEALDGNTHGQLKLADIAYTLQVGREAMDHRLATTVSSLDKLRQTLRRFVAGEEGIEEFYVGEVKRNKEALSLFTADEDLQSAITAWLEKGKYSKLLELWVKGLAFDWRRLYSGQTPRRISLPAYPFATDRYWITDMSELKKRSGAPASESSIEFEHYTPFETLAIKPKGIALADLNQDSRDDFNSRGTVVPKLELMLPDEEIFEPERRKQAAAPVDNRQAHSDKEATRRILQQVFDGSLTAEQAEELLAGKASVVLVK